MKIFSPSVITAIFIIAFLFLLSFLFNNKNPNFNKKAEQALKRQYDSSQKVIDSLSLRIKDVNLALNNLDSYNQLLIQQYQGKKQALQSLLDWQKKQSLSTKKYSIKQLDSAFAARFPKDTLKSDSTITIQKQVANNTVRELTVCDTLKNIISLYRFNDSILNLRLNDRDSVIVLKDSQIKDYSKIVENYTTEKQILVKQRSDLEDKLKNSKKKTFTAIVASIMLAILYTIK